MGPLLVWHRGDLRLHDHPALLEALARGPVVGLVVLDPNNLKTTPRPPLGEGARGGEAA